MFTSMQRVSLNPDYAGAFEDRFHQRPRRVDRFPGFIRNEVLRPALGGQPYVVLTHWEDRSGFDAWDRDRANHTRQNPLPSEAYLGTNLECYEVFLSAGGADTPEDAFTVMNRIFVKPDYTEQFEERFRHRAGLVDGMPGFVRNEVLRPTQQGWPYVVLTYWRDRKSFENWTSSDEFKQGHLRSGSLPREAFARANSLEMHSVILNSDNEDFDADATRGEA